MSPPPGLSTVVVPLLLQTGFRCLSSIILGYPTHIVHYVRLFAYSPLDFKFFIIPVFPIPGTKPDTEQALSKYLLEIFTQKSHWITLFSKKRKGNWSRMHLRDHNTPKVRFLFFGLMWLINWETIVFMIFKIYLGLEKVWKVSGHRTEGTT